MAIPKFLEDIAFISKLGDNPGTDNGLSTEGFKSVFDKAALKIQEYINNIIVPAVNSATSGGVYSVADVKPDEKGNVPLSATDVGARPSDWMPTASDVGARPSNWMPTASEVGATPASHATDNNNPHGVTADQVGAVPATRTVNGNALSSDISLGASDVGATSIKQLWGNASPQSDFPAQNISVDLNGYRFAMVEYIQQGGSYNATRIIAVGNVDKITEPNTAYESNSSTSANFSRIFGVFSNHIEVRTGYSNNSQSNSYIKPLRIYGIL